MATQGTLDVFRPNQVSADAAAITGRIKRIVWPATPKTPPRLAFVQPDLPTAERTGLPLTAIIGEPVRVQLQSEQYCTKCGSQAEQNVCSNCAGTPPLAVCVKQPAERCTYANCAYPEYKEQSCSHEFVIYLVAASGVKVGITKRTRTLSRWQEQGANHALPIATAPNRKAAGIIERAISQIDHIDQRLTHEWYDPMTDPQRKLVDAAIDAREVLPDRLTDCYRWAAPMRRDSVREDVVTVPCLATSDMNHRLTSRLGRLQPGTAREARVIGVRGALIATDEFIINTKRHAGHGITIETEGAFIEDFDAEAATTKPSQQTSGESASTGDAKMVTDAPDTEQPKSRECDRDYPLEDYF